MADNIIPDMSQFEHPAAPDDGPLGRVYTLAEAAEYLRISRHGLGKVARRTGHCSIFGRELRFSDSDLLALWDATRVEPKVREPTRHSPPTGDTSARLAAFLLQKKRRR